jgi:hypothetical protein
MPEPEEGLHKIEDIKRKLYDPAYPSQKHRTEGALHSVHHEVPHEWEDAVVNGELKHKNPPTTIFKKFFLGAIIFFVCAILFGIFMYMRGSDTVSSERIDITVLGNSFTEGGEELPLQIEIVNRNKSKLELSNMIIEYPRGASADNKTDMVRLPREQIGTIEAGGRIERNVKVALYGDQGTVREVTVHFEYHPQGSNAIFTKEVVYPVTISSSPLALRVDGPIQTSSNQEITLTVTASLNTSLPSAALLKVDYPSGFVFESASPAPVLDKSLWSLADLTQKTPAVITIHGRINGQDGDEQAFHVFAGTANPGDPAKVDVVYNSLLHTITLAKPFLEANITLGGNDADQYSVQSGQAVKMQVEWVNNLSTQISDAEIRVHFSGNVFDKNAVSVANGFYNSGTNEIIFDKNTISDFSSIQPGEKGRLEFSFTPLPVLGGDQNLKDPQVVIEVSIKGREPSSGQGFSEVNSFEKKVVRIMSDFQVAAQGRYISGLLPPTAEKDTIYNATLTLSNSANTIANAEARTVLPIYVKWGGLVGSTAENVTYNDVTREVVWKIGTVRPHAGFGGAVREVTFKITLTPSISQVGSIPQLIKDISLTGQDTFAGNLIKTSRTGLNTRLEGDPAFKFGDERVIK